MRHQLRLVKEKSFSGYVRSENSKKISQELILLKDRATNPHQCIFSTQLMKMSNSCRRRWRRMVANEKMLLYESGCVME